MPLKADGTNAGDAKIFTGTIKEKTEGFSAYYLNTVSGSLKSGLISQIELICDLYANKFNRSDLFTKFLTSPVMGISGLAGVYDSLPTAKEKWSAMIYSADHKLLLQILYTVYVEAGVDEKLFYPRNGLSYYDFPEVKA